MGGYHGWLVQHYVGHVVSIWGFQHPLLACISFVIYRDSDRT